MIVGVPTEVKDHEYRVSLVPAGVRALVQAGHAVLVQEGAGLGSGIDNAAYQSAGAVIVSDAAAVFRRACSGCRSRANLPMRLQCRRASATQRRRR